MSTLDDNKMITNLAKSKNGNFEKSSYILCRGPIFEILWPTLDDNKMIIFLAKLSWSQVKKKI